MKNTYKSLSNFNSGIGTCYVHAFTGKKYNRGDFLRISFGDTDLAARLFAKCVWERPESIVESMIDTGLDTKFEYGAPLQIWVQGEDKPLVPAHFVERQLLNGEDVFHVNWEGQFLSLETKFIRRVLPLDLLTFKGVSSANLNVNTVRDTYGK